MADIITLEWNGHRPLDAYRLVVNLSEPSGKADDELIRRFVLAALAGANPVNACAPITIMGMEFWIVSLERGA